MKNKIKHIFGGIKAAIIILLTFLLFPFARLFLWHKKIWIISERKNEARDNGFSFFKYMRENHGDINCYYAIKKQSPDFIKIKSLGNIIEFGSLKHFIYYCAARFLICSTTQGFCPSYYLTLLRKKMHLWGTYVFLQHGITKDNQTFLYKKASKIDLFICGAKPEYDDIVSHYGYNKNEVAYTGFARFDSYHNLSLKKQILVMPTWRRIANETIFKETRYFKIWSEFLNSQDLIKLIEDSNFELYFYIHPIFQKYSSMFKSSSSKVVVADFEHYNLQDILKSAMLMITDFSSVAFDFGYMDKPVVYYQYDEKEFFEKHYLKGYFDYRKDGFGPVCTTFKELISSLRKIINNNMAVDSTYNDNRMRFFPLHDDMNSERIFNAIKNIKNH